LELENGNTICNRKERRVAMDVQRYFPSNTCSSSILFNDDLMIAPPKSSELVFSLLAIIVAILGRKS
jgi:hypothetical protein